MAKLLSLLLLLLLLLLFLLLLLIDMVVVFHVGRVTSTPVVGRRLVLRCHRDLAAPCLTRRSVSPAPPCRPLRLVLPLRGAAPVPPLLRTSRPAAPRSSTSPRPRSSENTMPMPPLEFGNWVVGLVIIVGGKCGRLPQHF